MIISLTYKQTAILIVLTMYVDTSTVKQGEKSYTRHLLRESYREGKKVKHLTIANLSQCSAEEIAAIRLLLRHKKNLSELTTCKGKSFLQKQGLSIGAVWVVYDMPGNWVSSMRSAQHEMANWGFGRL